MEEHPASGLSDTALFAAVPIAVRERVDQR
jgi:hypothetical protein